MVKAMKRRFLAVDESNESSTVGNISETEDVEEHFEKNAPVNDEYEQDSSDEEDVENTIGDVPLRWYDEFDHVGYSRDAEKIVKPDAEGEIDVFLNRVGNPDFFRTVISKVTGGHQKLTDEDIDIISRITRARYPVSDDDAEPVWQEYFTGDVMETPLSARPEHKRSFIPSRNEALKVAKMVDHIKRGWIKLDGSDSAGKKSDRERFYMLWDENGSSGDMRRLQRRQPAPKQKLPGHELSYRPPPEYVPTESELSASAEGAVVPRSFNCLRVVPAYNEYIRDEFERCLSLYLCPRKTVLKQQLTGPEQLLPELPDRRELQPYPTHCALVYRGHRNLVRCLSVSPDGRLFASGSDDGTLRVWEVSSGRCLRVHRATATGAAVTAVAWNPNCQLSLVAVAAGRHIHVLPVRCGDDAAYANAVAVLSGRRRTEADVSDDKNRAGRYGCRWKTTVVDDNEDVTLSSDKTAHDSVPATGDRRLTLTVTGQCSQVCWHPAGDYFATIVPDAGNTSVLIHQLSRWRSQMPFKKSQRAQAAAFHPRRPYFFIATRNHVRIFNLAKQELSKKLSAGVKWVSSMAIHPAGDNVVIGSYDHRVHWFDLDLSSEPCHRLRYHGMAVRQVSFHKRYPLMCSAGDDTKIMVFHAKVSSDLSQQAQIVPVKMLKGHAKCEDLCVLDVAFHPEQPWLFSAGADGFIRLWV